MATRDFFRARMGQRTYTTVFIGEQPVRLRSLTADERTSINMRWVDENGKPTRSDHRTARRSLTYCLSIVDENGNPEYTGTDEELEMFGALPAKEADILEKAVTELSWAAVEDLTKKSKPATPSES